MLTIFLPGYSIENQEEQVNISNALEENNYKVYKHQWRHWEDPNIQWDPSIEVTRIMDFIKNSGETEISIIGKSIGTYISVKILKVFSSQIKLMILMGIPVKDFDEKEIEEFNVLDSTNVPLYLIQNNNDPHGTIDEAREILDDANFKELLMESETHEYEYVEDILEIYQENFQMA
ncbi:MAG: hypothetical protein ACMG57_05990 [Candidatus Dojkabacteria bacterium]